MALKKSELYSSIWAGCDELRGGMDASEYKNYVLVLLFIKYVSDKYAGKPYAEITVPKGASFADLVALKGKAGIGDSINKHLIAPLEAANNISFGGVDFNDPAKLGSGKEMVDKLTNLIAIFENPALDFSQNRADGDDLLGDAYEYLMRHFATEIGQSTDPFYTPAAVSRVIARVLGIRDAATSNKTTVYDPTCGSGSLLLKIGDEAAHHRKVRVSLYGQEKDSSTAGLARMNMILHGHATAVIKQGNTLANPLFTSGDALDTFDYVVANPPFSDKRWSTGLHPDEGGQVAADGTVSGHNYHRFDGYGIPPAKQGDYAYLLHILKSLKSTGRGACILPHGVLFRGNAEGVIRRALIQRGVIEAIIGLPANLFYGTGIPACLVVLDKAGAAARKGIFLIDASKGYRKDGNKNRLREQDIHRIVDTFTRQDTSDPSYARLVPVTEIASEKNDYNLNLPRYIDATEPEDLQDITAHLRGGIPDRDLDALQRFWEVLPGVRSALFKPLRKDYSAPRVPSSEFKATILSHEEFTAFTATAKKRFIKWRNAITPQLTGLTKTSHPKALIETISEDLLSFFETAPLLDAYDVYQHLMDYWAETMQDDVYLITSDGWREAAQPRLIVEDKKNKSKPRPDFVVGKKKYQCELIPPALVIDRWFAKEQAAVDALAAEVESLSAQLTELEEEHGGEDGTLGSLEKLTRATVKEALDDLGGPSSPSALSGKVRAVAEPSAPYGESELSDSAILQRWLDFHEQQSDKRAALREAENDLTHQTYEKFTNLTVDEIKTLVVDEKWLVTLATAVQGELDRVSQTITSRIRLLADRYGTPVSALEDELEALSAKVSKHLNKMGESWK